MQQENTVETHELFLAKTHLTHVILVCLFLLNDSCLDHDGKTRDVSSWWCWCNLCLTCIQYMTRIRDLFYSCRVNSPTCIKSPNIVTSTWTSLKRMMVWMKMLSNQGIQERMTGCQSQSTRKLLTSWDSIVMSSLLSLNPIGCQPSIYIVFCPNQLWTLMLLLLPWQTLRKINWDRVSFASVSYSLSKVLFFVLFLSVFHCLPLILINFSFCWTEESIAAEPLKNSVTFFENSNILERKSVSGVTIIYLRMISSKNLLSSQSSRILSASRSKRVIEDTLPLLCLSFLFPSSQLPLMAAKEREKEAWRKIPNLSTSKTHDKKGRSERINNFSLEENTHDLTPGAEKDRRDS